MTDKQIEALEKRIQPKVEKFFHGVSRSIHTSTIFIAELIAAELVEQRQADKARYTAQGMHELLTECKKIFGELAFKNPKSPSEKRWNALCATFLRKVELIKEDITIKP